MKSYISIILLILILCIKADLKAQIVLPYFQDFESVTDTIYTTNQTALVGLEEWSYSSDKSGIGRLSLGNFQNDSRVLKLNRSINDNSTNYLMLTIDMSSYSVFSDGVLLDFDFFHDHANYDSKINSVFVRGDETSDWIVLYDWYENRGSDKDWVFASALSISDSLAAHEQEFSSTFQVQFGDDGFWVEDGLILDNIKVYSVPFVMEGRSGSITPSNSETAYFGLGENVTETFNDFWKADAQGDFTMQAADFPGVGRESAVSFMIDDQVYVGSGADAEGSHLSDFYRYDPETDSWTQIADFGGGARSRAVAFAIGDYGYVGTGLNETDEQSDFWKYDPETDSWTEMTGWGADKRQQAFVFVIDDQAYVGGGFYFDSFQFQLSDIQRYDPESETWTEKIFADGLNLAMNNATAFSLYGYGYIAYGNQDHLIKYDPRTNEVENLGDYFEWGSSRSGASAYVFGDAARVGLGRSGVEYPTTFETYNEENVVPSDLSISSNDINENEPVGTFVGVLTAEDEDEIYGLTYMLTVGDGSNDASNDHFYISQDSLFTNQVLNYELQTSYDIHLSAIDSRGGLDSEAFSIYITDINDAPDSLLLSNLTVAENNGSSVLVGELTNHDEDNTFERFSYSLKSSDGITDADNAEFYFLDGYKLVVRTPDFEEKSLYRVNLEVQDFDGASLERSFEITITDVNEAPTEIELALDDDLENRLVGMLSTLDEDTEDTFTYVITSEESIFELVENELWIKEGVSAEIKELYGVSIETTDSGGLSFTKVFEVQGNEVLLDAEPVSQAIKIYPNPFEDYLYIDTKTLTKVEIYTLSGVRLISREAQGIEQTINTTQLPSGMYILKSYTNTGFTDLKLIKE